MAQDLQLRRTVAGINNRVQTRLTQMEHDLREAHAELDPLAVNGAIRQQLRAQRLQARSARIVREAYADCRRIAMQDAFRVAKAAADMSVQTLREEIP